MTARTLEERFWPKVQKTDGCWLWTGQLHKDWGYGRVYVQPPNVRRMAHVVSWELTHGPVPKKKLVLHKCDNPPCVRPDHLFLGTNHTNMQDMAKKGRQWLQKDSSKRRGELNPVSKLTAAAVEEIRSAPKTRGMQAALARKFDVSTGQINRVLKGLQWKEVQA